MTERDRAAKQSLKRDRLEYLRKKHQDRDKIAEEKPMYYFSIALKWILQVGCALLAGCGFASLVADFIDNPIIVSCVCMVGLLVLELAISYTGSKVALANRKGKEQNGRILAIFVACVLFSVGSTYLGADSTIDYFIKSPALVSLDDIESKYNDRLAANTNSWNEKSLHYENKANEIHNQMNYKGVTVRGAQKLHTELEQSAKAMKDSLAVHESIIMSAYRADLAKANEDNINLQKAHEDKVVFYGNCLKWIALAGYVLVFILMLFIEDYEIREEKYLEQEVDFEPRGESSSDTPMQSQVQVRGTQEAEKVTEGQSEGQRGIEIGAKGKEKSKISFKDYEFKDGDIQTFDNPNKKPRIYLKKKDGEIKGYKESELKGLIKQSSEARAESLKPYLEKLQKANEL